MSKLLPFAAFCAALAVSTPAWAENDTWEINGFAQLDVIYDSERLDPDWLGGFRPSKIPVVEDAFGSGSQTTYSVRQTRINTRAAGEAGDRPYEARFEFDLFGTGVDAGETTFRIRHAYGRWGPVLAGQTWTLFMDTDLIPAVIDAWGPPGRVFLRNPQLRAIIAESPTFSAAVALEKPRNDVDAGLIRQIDPEFGADIRAYDPLPDFTGQVRFMGDWGHVQLSGILRKVAFESASTPDNEPSGSELGWGINVGSHFIVGPATFRVGAVYGEGIASYMSDGGVDLAPEVITIAPPNVQEAAVPLFAFSAYVDLRWSPELTTSLGYSQNQVENTNFQAANAFHRGQYASANLLWAPIPRVLTGFEVLWGQRTDNNGAQGDNLRLQFSFRVNFSSNDLRRN